MDFTVASYAAWRAEGADGTVAKPDVSFIPPLERRRLTGVERAALAVAWQVRPEGEVPVVFASRWGEIGVTVKLMTQFHADREMSPAGFSASVHNAAPGAFSLLTHNHAPYTAIAARERSLEAGLLEALAQGAAARSVSGPYQGVVRLETGRVATCCDRIGRPCRADFHSTECAPVSFDAADAFFSGRADALEAASFTLTRA